MRLALVALVLFALPSLADDSPPIAARMPAGATAYFEVNGLGQRVQALWESPLADSIRNHPAMLKFLASPEGQKFQMGQGMLQGMLGMDAKTLLQEIGKGQIAGAMYGTPQNLLLVLEIDPKLANRPVGAIEFASQKPRTEAVAKDDNGPAIFQVGKAFVCIEPTLTIISPSVDLVSRVRAREGETMATSAQLAEARRLAPGAPLAFGMLDLKPFHAKMAENGKPKDFGQALILGAFPHELRSAPWAAFAFDLRPEGRDWKLHMEGVVPMPEQRSEKVQAAFGGTLKDLPFELPEETLAVVRMKRNLRSLWEFQDDFIAAKALPKLVQFSGTFETLTGLTFSEEVLPRLGGEVTFVAIRRTWADGEQAPEVKLPHMALIWPIKTDDRMRQSMDLAFQQVMSLIGLQQKQMSRKFMVMRESYKEIPIMTARYPSPAKGEMEGRRAMPIRYNFEPAAAVVGEQYVIASSTAVLKRLIDAREGSTKAPAGKNAGFWLNPQPAVAMLRANRPALVAQHMIKEGVDKATAEQVIGMLLDAASMLTEFSFTADESRAATGLSLHATFTAPEAK